MPDSDNWNPASKNRKITDITSLCCTSSLLGQHITWFRGNRRGSQSLTQSCAEYEKEKTAELRGVVQRIFLCATLRYTLRNSAVNSSAVNSLYAYCND